VQATTPKFLRALVVALCLVAGIAFAQDDLPPPPELEVLISVPDQKLVVLRDGGLIGKYRVSTSRFGVGDSYGSYKTPLGRLRVCDKIGGDLSPGAVIKHRSATGEVIPVNAPGRDPIVTRVIWLDGLDEENRNAKARGIYIHGTPEESNLGKPVSWGCIRMRSEDVIELYNEIGPGTPVTISPDRLPHLHKYRPPPPPPPPVIIVTATPPPAPVTKVPPAAKQTPAPQQSQLIVRSTPAPAPVSKSQQLPAVSEHLVADREALDRNSPIAHMFREAAAPEVGTEKPGKVSSNPGAWQAMKGSILTAGLSDTTLTAPAPKRTPVTPVPESHEQPAPASLDAANISLKEIADGLSFTEAKLRADAAHSADTLTQNLLEPFTPSPPSGSLAARATEDESSTSATKASQ